MAETVQFTQEEVQSINQLRQEVANIFTQLGQLTIERNRRLDELDDIEEHYWHHHSSDPGHKT